MILYKCKMCGGNLNITEGSKTTTCEYCQTQQTVPAADDEKRANLFNRANHFRQNSEFDKAMGIYEHILEEDSSDAEAYWSVVLCRYGIEYVEDPATKIQKPTVNRTQVQSILKDADYLMALEHADLAQKALYEKEAQEIDRLQSDILQIAQNEQPYDIFISYKEKAPDGERTRSSVLAQDVYNHLKEAGYRVFFSRISLEDKVGQKYEPYIYSALNSSKVMLVIGTQKEEFMAPWVRNEWSRFLTMMRQNTGKLLIPCFRDLDIDDLPNEFQILQSQDMSKIGCEQDLIHGIEKAFNNNRGNEKKHAAVHMWEGSSVTVEPLLDRAFICMKDGDFIKADNLFEQVLNVNPHEGRAYLGKLMCEHGTKKKEELSNAQYPLYFSRNYRHILEDGDAETGKWCQNCNEEIIKKSRKIINERIAEKKSGIDLKIAGIKEDVTDINVKIKCWDDILTRQNNKIKSIQISRSIIVIIGISVTIAAIMLFCMSFRGCTSGNLDKAEDKRVFLQFIGSLFSFYFGSCFLAFGSLGSKRINKLKSELERDLKNKQDQQQVVQQKQIELRELENSKNYIEQKSDQIAAGLLCYPRNMISKNNITIDCVEGKCWIEIEKDRFVCFDITD